ncbi:hypothetical protein AgCh_017729 [Apium graveolens]
MPVLGLGTEEALGEAISQARILGLIKSRDEVFITSKLWCLVTKSSLPQSSGAPIIMAIMNMKLEYLDQYLIHWPVNKKLADILSLVKIPPAINQANGIMISAYFPLGAGGAVWGPKGVLESEVLIEIAKSKGKSVVQVALRWAYEQGVVIVTKNFNKERQKQNMEIFDWELSDEESKIAEIPQSRANL